MKQNCSPFRKNGSQRIASTRDDELFVQVALSNLQIAPQICMEGLFLNSIAGAFSESKWRKWLLKGAEIDSFCFIIEKVYGLAISEEELRLYTVSD